MADESFGPGTSIGPYRIIARIGAGGMGEVYQAQDTKLGREVALKVLPDAFAHDSERRMRFEREARMLAALNHPNIATLHGLQEFGRRTILEMELVPGVTLGERLGRGDMSNADTLAIFRQIALALEAAHDRGIIHRDLKPTNIKVMPDGRVKVLDFGLAKVFERDPDLTDITQSPSTETIGGGGAILGTAQYMSPEQARGLPLDRRTDIWSFGCVLFEAFTGQTPFKAETASDTMAAILKDEPDWRLLVRAPSTIQRLVRRCLRKDPQARLRDIADARIEIEEALSETASLPQPPALIRARRRLSAAVVAAAVLGAALLAGASTWYFSRTVMPAPMRARVAIAVTTGHRLALGQARVLALSPDGAQLVYAAAEAGARTQLFVRRLDRFEAVPIPGTESASAPFFSPDGEWVGFHARDALYKVSLAGGAPLKICDVPAIWSASWGEDDHILFSSTLGDGVWRVSAGGGTPQQRTKPDAAKSETQHAFPQSLGGERVLFTVAVGGRSVPAVLSLGDNRWRTLPQVTVGGGVQYVATGHLVYAQGGGLVAVRFDADSGELRGSPIPLLDRVAAPPYGAAQFAVSRAGSLVYLPGETVRPSRTLMMVDDSGRATSLGSGGAAYAHPRLSPEGRSLAVTIETETGSDIWVFDLQRGTRTRLTSGGASAFPIWAPDGRTVTYHSVGSNQWTLFTRAADGSSASQPLLTMERSAPGAAPAMASLLPGTLPSLSGANPQFPVSWSGDGRTLAFTERKPSAERDIWVMETGSDPSPFLVTPFDESAPAFSPDGRFLAYVSDESGRPEVYVQPYPGPGGRWLVSTDGGTDPVWAASGRELFYRRNDEILAVPVQLTAAFNAGTPRRVFEGRFEVSDAARNYDVSRDGQRFVMVRSDESGASPQFHAVFNWFGELEERAPVKP